MARTDKDRDDGTPGTCAGATPPARRSIGGFKLTGPGHFELGGQEGSIEFYLTQDPAVQQVAMTWASGTVSLYMDGELVAVVVPSP